MKNEPFNALPTTPKEMAALLVKAGLSRAYVDLRHAATRGRLTENDIADIEHTVLVETGKIRGAQPEFSFDVVAATEMAENMLKHFFALAKEAGKKKPAEF